MTSKPDFKVMVLLLPVVFMQLTRDLFAIAKFLLYILWRRFTAYIRALDLQLHAAELTFTFFPEFFFDLKAIVIYFHSDLHTTYHNKNIA